MSDKSTEILDDIVSYITKPIKNVFIYSNCYDDVFNSKGQFLNKKIMGGTLHFGKSIKSGKDQGGLYHYFHEEDLGCQTFQDVNFDLIFSNLSLQFLNDIGKALSNYRDHLSQNGLFIANILGGSTLHELKYSLCQADLCLHSSVMQRVMPMISVESCIALIQRAGFEIPVIASEKVTIEYETLRLLLNDLKHSHMGNFMNKRSSVIPKKSFFDVAEALYKEHFRGIKATFEIITLLGSYGGIKNL